MMVKIPGSETINASEGMENIPEEHVDEFEDALKELEDLIAKI